VFVDVESNPKKPIFEPETPTLNALVSLLTIGYDVSPVDAISCADKVVAPLALSVVNAPVEAVVAPTVPLILIEAVPVRLVTVPLEGVPSAGVTKVGEVAKTAEPVPVSSVKAERRLAELGVARKVATPVPRPDTPVAIGRPVAFVKVALVGVPRIGVTRVGEVASTLLPVPVLVTETMFLLASNAKAVEAVKPDSVAVLDADRVVNAPVPAVVAPTGPLNESPTAPV
jgi:hypothetical protein